MTYLHDAWVPEVIELWNRSHARPDAELVERNVMLAVGAKQYTERDFDD